MGFDSCAGVATCASRFQACVFAQTRRLYRHWHCRARAIFMCESRRDL